MPSKRVRACISTATCVSLALSMLVLGSAFGECPFDATQREVDMSGYGRCDGRKVHVQHASLWTQWPSPLAVTPLPNASAVSSVLPMFKARNSVIWSAKSNTVVQGFVVESTDGATFTTSEDLHLEGDCHFTLDAAQINPPLEFSNRWKKSNQGWFSSNSCEDVPNGGMVALSYCVGSSEKKVSCDGSQASVREWEGGGNRGYVCPKCDSAVANANPYGAYPYCGARLTLTSGDCSLAPSAGCWVTCCNF